MVILSAFFYKRDRVLRARSLGMRVCIRDRVWPFVVFEVGLDVAEIGQGVTEIRAKGGDVIGEHDLRVKRLLCPWLRGDKAKSPPTAG